MTSTYPAGESYAAFRDAGRFAFHVPVAARTRVTRINGKNRVESVEIQNLDTGARRTVHWTPSSPPGTGSPRTSSPAPPAWTSTPPPEGPRRQRPLHQHTRRFRRWQPAAPCRHCRHRRARRPHVGAQVRQWLRTRHAPGSGVTLIADPPLRWNRPQILRPGDSTPARHRLLAWPGAYVPVPHVQDGKVLDSRRLPRPAPGRVFRIPSSLLTRAGALSTEGTIHITLANAPKP